MSGNDDLGSALAVYTWVFFSISVIVVALRIWTRLGHLMKTLQIHDILMICSVVCEAVHCALIQLAIDYGLGQHVDILLPENISTAAKYNVINEIFSVVPSYFGRMSFAFFLLSVVTSIQRWQQWTLWVVIVLNTLINLGLVVHLCTQCGAHLSARWSSFALATKYCVSNETETKTAYTQATTQAVSDLVLTIIPVSIISMLTMPLRNKIGLSALLALSFFAFFASIAKTLELKQLSDGPDITYNFALLQFAVVTEDNLVIIGASIPMLRALFIRKRASSSNRSGPEQSGNTNPVTRQTCVRGNSAYDEERVTGDTTEKGIQRTIGTSVSTDASTDYVKAKKESGIFVEVVGGSSETDKAGWS